MHCLSKSERENDRENERHSFKECVEFCTVKNKGRSSVASVELVVYTLKLINLQTLRSTECRGDEII